MRRKRKQADGEAPPIESKRVTPVDIQQKEFRLAMRGYNERDVDQFLDEVTEEVARLYADNKRLREEIEFSRTTRLATTDGVEGEAVIRRAREEAARIIADAQARASTVVASGDPGQAGGATPASVAPQTEGMGIFLARERAFLQNMANLIQTHAEGVKQDVRRVRERVDRQPPVVATPAEQTPAEQAPGEPVQSSGDEAAAAAPTEAGADEPTQAWTAAAAEPEPIAQHEAGSSEILDLTASGEREVEETPPRAPGVVSDPWDAEAAMSGVYGQNRATFETGPPSRKPGEGRSSDDASPKAEDDDPREDRSLRELFWGED